MIRLAEGALAPRFWETAEGFGIFGTKLYAQGRIYGLSGGPLEMWLLLHGARPVGALSRLAGAFCLAGWEDAPMEELSSFLPAVGGCCLEGPLPLVKRLAAL